MVLLWKDGPRSGGDGSRADMVDQVAPINPQRRETAAPLLRLAPGPVAPGREPGASPPRAVPSEQHRAALAAERVAYENACAAMLQPADARWIFALRVSHALEGGKAALLTPPKRRELIAAAVGAGLREFDANLVIAVVQDAARRGELGERAKAIQGMGPSLAMVGVVRRPGAGTGRLRTAVIVTVTVVASLVCFAFMVRWLMGG